MSDFFEIPNSTTDFKSRSNDVFDKLVNLEKQHQITQKPRTIVTVPEDDAPSSTHQNPLIPSHAIVFKKRPVDDDAFARPVNKWQKYDLDDVNEHHLSSSGNRHALNDFFRTRVKPSDTKLTEEKDELPQTNPIFKRPMKKEILSNDNDDDDDQQHMAIRAPLPSQIINTTANQKNDDDDNDKEISAYKLKSSQKKTRGVLSTTKKQSPKISMEIPEEEQEEDDDEINDELFEP